MAVGAVGYFAACFFNDHYVLLTSFLILATAGVFIAIPIFWTIPQQAFDRAGRLPVASRRSIPSGS